MNELINEIIADKSYVGLEELKRQIKQAEEYQPND